MQLWEDHSDSSVYFGCFIARTSKQCCKHHLHSASQDLCHFCGWTCSQGKDRKNWTHCWLSDPPRKCKGMYALLVNFHLVLWKRAWCFSSIQNLYPVSPQGEKQVHVIVFYITLWNVIPYFISSQVAQSPLQNESAVLCLVLFSV